MAAKIRKRIAVFCRALAARLDPPGVVARCALYTTTPPTSGTAATGVLLTFNGDTVGP